MERAGDKNWGLLLWEIKAPSQLPCKNPQPSWWACAKKACRRFVGLESMWKASARGTHPRGVHRVRFMYRILCKSNNTKETREDNSCLKELRWLRAALGKYEYVPPEMIGVCIRNGIRAESRQYESDESLVAETASRGGGSWWICLWGNERRNDTGYIQGIRSEVCERGWVVAGNLL